MKEPFFKFSVLGKFPEIIHGISNRGYGDMKLGNLSEKIVLNNRKQFYSDLGIEGSDVVSCNQIHGSNVSIVSEKNKNSSISKTDGLITASKGVFLMIKTADCIPVLLFDPLRQIVGAVHVGWRGVLNQIILRSLDKFIELGSSSENIIVSIGPAICQKHFIVRDEVLKEFLACYSSATMVRNKDGYVDLKKAVAIDLIKSGIPKENIEISNECTVCDNGKYGSFRKEGKSAPEMASIIGMKP